MNHFNGYEVIQSWVKNDYSVILLFLNLFKLFESVKVKKIIRFFTSTTR
jgi:hypothetical protein